jgi:hypothetical protein
LTEILRDLYKTFLKFKTEFSLTENLIQH